MASHTERQPQLENIGSLITYRDESGDRCLGYLVCFEGHRVYDPSFGRMEITPERRASGTAISLRNSRAEMERLAALAVSMQGEQGTSEPATGAASGEM